MTMSSSRRTNTKPGKYRSNTWVLVCMVCFLFGGHFPLAESFTWTELPPNPFKVIAGSTATFSWCYDLENLETLTYIECTRVKDGNPFDIGDMNADGVITISVPNASLSVTNQSAILNMHGVKTADQAKYCFKLVTSKARQEKCIHLKVLVPPKPDVYPINKTVNQTGTINLFCNATGIPAPIISWTKVGSDKQLRQSDHLVIQRADKEDSGMYMCVASSEAGSATATAFVDVQYKPRNTTLLSSAVMDTAPVDGSVTLDCSTDANPPAHVFSIYHEGSLITQNASFTIERVTWSDEGEYTCVPYNILGEGKNASIALTVFVYRPEKKIPKNWIIIAGPVLCGVVVLVLCGAIARWFYLHKDDTKKDEKLTTIVL